MNGVDPSTNNNNNNNNDLNKEKLSSKTRGRMAVAQIKDDSFHHLD